MNRFFSTFKNKILKQVLKIIKEPNLIFILGKNTFCFEATQFQNDIQTF